MTFRTKTILGIAVIGIFLLMILVFSSIFLLSKSNENLQIQRAISTAKIFSHAINNAIISNNIATVDALVKDFIDIEGVKYIKVVEHGHTLTQSGNQALLSRPMKVDKDLDSINDSIVDTQVSLQAGGIKYGFIDMGFESPSITMILDQAKASIVSIASLELVLVVIFSYILGNYLSNNLTKLSRDAKTLASRSPGYHMREKPNDELETIEKSLNKTIEIKSSTIRQNLVQSKILVAESDKPNQLVIKKMLQNIGIEIDTAESGIQAVKKVLENEYALIFMDISIPNMDSMQTCQKIRGSLQNKKEEVPIIALTTHALTENREKFIAAGFTDYLSKPLRLDHVINKINLYIGKSHSDIRLNMSQGRCKQIPPLANYNNESLDMNETAFNSDLIDEDILKQTIVDTCVEVIPEIIDQYVEESQNRLIKVREAADIKDAETLEFESHTLGSTALTLGNRKLSCLARKIETYCIEKNEQQAFELIPELLELADNSIKALLERKALGFEDYTRSTE